MCVSAGGGFAMVPLLTAFTRGPLRLLLMLTLPVAAASCSDERREPAQAPSSSVSAANDADAITGSRALDVVRQHLLTNRVYPDVTDTCLNLASHGQRSGGWVIAAFDGCSLTESQTHRRLGQWHVESTTLRVRRLEDV